MTVIGIGCGAAAALAVSRLLSAHLFGVGGRDPRAYAAVALLILIVTLLASVLPTLRASRVTARRPAHGAVDGCMLQLVQTVQPVSERPAARRL